MGNIVDKKNPRRPRIAGFQDKDLHSGIHEAMKLLEQAKEVYARTVANIDGQYLNALDSASDGDSPACLSTKAQVAAVRNRF